MKTLIVEPHDEIKDIPEYIEKLVWKKYVLLPRLPSDLLELEANNVNVIMNLPKTLVKLKCKNAYSIRCELPDSLKYLESNELIELFNLPNEIEVIKAPRLNFFKDKRHWLLKLFSSYFPKSLKVLHTGIVKSWPELPKADVLVTSKSSKDLDYITEYYESTNKTLILK